MSQKKAKNNTIKRLGQESGQALIIVLVLLLLGSLILPPVLAHIGTALKSNRVYQPRADQQYAADSGVEDAIWKIKYGGLQALFDDPDDGFYDFDTVWSYTLMDDVNGETTNVSLQNVWIPYAIDPPDDAAQTREILEDESKLMVSGTAGSGESDPYTIKIDFAPDVAAGDNLTLTSVGVWLPGGFTYADESCNLMDNPLAAYYPSSENVSDHCGGQAVVWTFSPPVDFTLFPDTVTANSTISAEVTFDYIALKTGTKPDAIAWLTTDKSGVIDNILDVTWDIDTRYFKIVSSSGDTEIEAYASKCELRNLNKAMSGDYVAIGNSLMGGDVSERDEWLEEDGQRKQPAVADSIPNGGEDDDGDYGDVVAAYLYWSAYCNGDDFSDFSSPLVSDNCAATGGWTQTGTVWSASSGRIRGHYNSEGDESRYLTWTQVYDLSGYDEDEVVVEWDQDFYYSYYYKYLDETDGLTFELSGDGGDIWSDPITAFYDDLRPGGEQYYCYTVPDEYLTSEFTIRFHLEDCSDTNEYIYIDDFAIAEVVATADTAAKFWIDDLQVYLDDGEAAIGIVDVTATESHVRGFERDEYAYACKLDVTSLVKAYAETVEDEYENDHHTGNAEYTVGDVDGSLEEQRSYAGWSLIIIYSSPSSAGHLLKLYDTLAFNTGYQNLDFDFDGVPGGDIGGFIVPEQIEGETVAANLTCFVGEGDARISGDTLKFNDTRLWDGENLAAAGYGTKEVNTAANPGNAWNSKSIGMSADGVDIDTFTITWDSGLIQPGDTTAHIDMWSNGGTDGSCDNYMMIYLILSMRAETTVGGTGSYVIH